MSENETLILFSLKITYACAYIVFLILYLSNFDLRSLNSLDFCKNTEFYSLDLYPNPLYINKDYGKRLFCVSACFVDGCKMFTPFSSLIFVIFFILFVSLAKQV